MAIGPAGAEHAGVDTGHAVRVLGIVGDEKAAVRSRSERGIAEVTIGQARADEDGTLRAPARAAILREVERDAVGWAPAAGDRGDAAVAQLDEIGWVVGDAGRLRLA